MLKEILIVENESIIAMDLKNICDNLGFKSSIVSNNEEVNKKLKSSNPDLILLDLEADNNLNLIDEAEKICKFYKIPVLFFTRAEPTRYKNHKLEEKCEFISVPFRSEDISQAILRLTK